jgi:hypothetical protein
MPQVRLEEISFNHSNRRTSGSISIKSAGQSVTAPEWRQGTIKPQDSLVAYAINQHRETITVLVRLSSPDQSVSVAEVQAIAEDGNVLGHVQSRTVNFNSSGESEILPFIVPAPRFQQFGVNVGTATWQWQFRIQTTDEWTSIDKTNHQIYVLIDTPVDPWNSETPWAEVLDKACDWARGARSADEAASKITNELYALGDSPKKLLSYQQTPTYAQGVFNLTGFLELLNGAVNVPARINCDDCATVVSTFGNILGGKLFQSEMGDSIHTHHVRLIGKSKWIRVGFYRHAVAWKEPCLGPDPLFDACLQVDGDGNPADHSKFKAVVPANVPFDGPSNYRFSFFRKGSCQPRPGKQKRRPLGRGFLGQVKYTDPVFLAFLKNRYDFELWPPEDKLGDPKHSKGLIDRLPSLPDFESWQSGDRDPFGDEVVAGVTFLLKRVDLHTNNLVEVNYYKVKTQPGINDFVLQLLAQFHQSDVKRETANLLGTLTFVEPRGLSVVFVRRGIVTFVRSVGRDCVSVFDIATTIDAFLARA